MKTTLALSWRSLVSRIHPPLSVTPRDSRKLLGLLHSSFQRHLDAQHSTDLQGQSHFAKSHIESILGNPLFGVKSRPRQGISGNGLQDDQIYIRGLQYWMDQPLAAFRMGVTNGTATLETAKLCLEIHFKKCLTSSISSADGVMDTADIGSVMLNWLWSLGMEKSGSYLRDLEFTRLLVLFLAIEQQYAVIYKLFSEVQTRSTALTDRLSKIDYMQQAQILLQLVKAETSFGAGLGAAMVHFNQYFQRNATEKVNRWVYGPAGNVLAHELADPGKVESVPQDVLSTFVSSRGWTDSSSFANAIQHVSQPDDPRPEATLRYLWKLSTGMLKHPEGPSYRHRLIYISLKTAELLLENDQQQEADWVMNFVQSNFSQEIEREPGTAGPIIGPKKAMKHAEATNLRLLESLAVS